MHIDKEQLNFIFDTIGSPAVRCVLYNKFLNLQQSSYILNLQQSELDWVAPHALKFLKSKLELQIFIYSFIF